MKKKINKTKTKTRHFSKVTRSKEMISTSSTTTTTQFLRRRMNIIRWIDMLLWYLWKYKFNRSVWKYFPRRWEYY